MSEAGSKPIGQQRAIGFWILITIVTFFVATLFWSYKTHEELFNHRGQGLGAGVGLLVAWLTGHLATAFIIPNEVAALYEEDGREAPFTWKIGFWILLPIIGSYIWFSTVQGALNEFWGSKGAPAP